MKLKESLPVLGLLGTLMLPGVGQAQLRVQDQLAQIDRSFVCPESLPDDEARSAALTLFLKQVAAVEPHISITELVDYRVNLLRKHQCVVTLANISRREQLSLLPTVTKSVATAFYQDLGRGDGIRASDLIVPEKRLRGPLSIISLTDFFGNLFQPLRLRSVESEPSGDVYVTYVYASAPGRVCHGHLKLSFTNRGGVVLISRINAEGSC